VDALVTNLGRRADVASPPTSVDEQVLLSAP
jgi:hypothetical protein